MKVSRLLAVTLFTPKRMVLNSLPWKQVILFDLTTHSQCFQELKTKTPNDKKEHINLESLCSLYLRGIESCSEYVGDTAIVYS